MDGGRKSVAQFCIFVVKQKQAFRKATKEKKIKNNTASSNCTEHGGDNINILQPNHLNNTVASCFIICSDISKTQIAIAKAIGKTNLQANQGAVIDAEAGLDKLNGKTSCTMLT